MRSATEVATAAAATAPTRALPYRPLPGTTWRTNRGMTSGAMSEPTPIANDVAVSSGV